MISLFLCFLLSYWMKFGDLAFVENEVWVRYLFLVLVLSVVMCLVIDPRLSLIFIVAMVVLGVSLWQIISRVSKLFQQVFEKYDALNESVGENVAGIRVVKAFVREKFENEKFARAAEGLYKLYVRAESLMALNHPVMNMVVYGCMIALSWWGAHFIVGGTLTTGELTSLFTYVMSILQALRMLSMMSCWMPRNES